MECRARTALQGQALLPGVSQSGTGAACGPHKCWVLLFVGGMMPQRKPFGNV